MCACVKAVDHRKAPLWWTGVRRPLHGKGNGTGLVISSAVISLSLLLLLLLLLLPLPLSLSLSRACGRALYKIKFQWDFAFQRTCSMSECAETATDPRAPAMMVMDCICNSSKQMATPSGSATLANAPNFDSDKDDADQPGHCIRFKRDEQAK